MAFRFMMKPTGGLSLVRPSKPTTARVEICRSQVKILIPPEERKDFSNIFKHRQPEIEVVFEESDVIEQDPGVL